MSGIAARGGQEWGGGGCLTFGDRGSLPLDAEEERTRPVSVSEYDCMCTTQPSWSRVCTSVRLCAPLTMLGPQSFVHLEYHRVASMLQQLKDIAHAPPSQANAIDGNQAVTNP